MKQIVNGEKAGSKSAAQPKIANDSAKSLTEVDITIGLSEGEIEGFERSDITLDGTPLTELSSEIVCDYRFGTNNQTHIDGLDDVSNEVKVGVEIKDVQPWVKAITNTSLDALLIRLSWSALRTQHSNGDVDGATVSYRIELAKIGESYATVLEATVSDKTSDDYQRTHEVTLPPSENGWMIRVVRTSPNSTSDLVSDKMYIRAYSELIKAKFTYPYTAYLRLKYDAEMFSNIAKVAVEARGLKIKVPSNYNPETGVVSGIWDGKFKLAYSNNPAWVYYDICTNPRYGLGDRIKSTMIDKWSLYRLAQYCDQQVEDGYGGLERRFTVNLYIQSKEKAYDIVNRLGGLFRAITFWDGQQIICDADIPQDTFFLYTNSNVKDGLFEYSDTAATEKYSAAIVAWDNPANKYETEYEAVVIDELVQTLGYKALEIDAWGCTSKGQAVRAGRWALLAETDTVTFSVGMDGHIPIPGKIIEVQDQLHAGVQNGGRILEISEDLKTIKIDKEIEILAGDMFILNSQQGTISRTVSKADGKFVTVSEAFEPGTIEIHRVWILNRPTIVAQKFRILSIKSDDNTSFTISAVKYNQYKFDEIDFNLILDERPTSVLNPTAQESVRNVTIEPYDILYQGLTNVNLVIKWERPEYAVKYLVEWKKDNGSWIKLPLTGNNSVEIEKVYAGNYIARVTAISAFDLYSLPSTSALTTVKGKQTKPLPPMMLSASTDQLLAINLSWVFPSGSEDISYVRILVSAENPKSVTINDDELDSFDKAYPDTSIRFDNLPINTELWFKVKAVDKLGLSSDYTDWVKGIADSDPEKILDVIQGHIGKEILDKELQDEFVNIDNRITDTKEIADAANNAAIAARNVADNAARAAATANTAANNAQTAANAAKADASSALTSAKAAQKSADDLRYDVNEAFIVVTEKYDKAVVDLNDGLTVERKARQDGDTKITTDMTAYKLSNDAAVTTALTQSEQAISASSANSTLIQGVQATLNTKNRTYRQDTAPTTGLIVGDIWYNSTVGKNSEAKRWNGSVWVDLTDPRTALNATAISKTEADVKDLGAKQTATSTKLDGVAANLDSLTKTVDTKVDSAVVTQIQADVKKNKDDISSTSSRVTTVEGNMQTMQGDINKKAENSVVVAQQQQINTIGGKVDTNVKDITSLRSDLTTTQKGLATKVEAAVVDGIDVRLKETEKGLASEVAKTTALESSIGTLIDSVSITGDNNVALDIVPDATFSKGTITVSPAQATGRKAIKAGSGSGTNDQVWARATGMLPFDATRTYRLRARFWRSKGEGKIYVGVAALTSDKKQYITTTGTKSADMGSSTHLYNGLTPAQDVRVEVEYFIKGMTNGAATGSGTIDDPKQMQYDTAYISPMFIAGYQNIAGSTVYFDYVTLEIADAMMVNRGTAKAVDQIKLVQDQQGKDITSIAQRTTAVEAGLVTANNNISNKADASVVNQIKADVESQGNKITANTTNITKQETRLSAVEKQTTDMQASITTNYYTKGQTDDKAKEIAAGVVNVYDASLVIGGVNAVINSEAERSSAASTHREYLMYERSEALKAFYDENLGKPVTISFEVKMPVAGQLQIYASNGSFHAFEASTQITQVNVWTKVVVTVTPRVNTGSTNPTQSTLEFYGVAYGSGRIPTVRKVQVEAGTKATAWSPSPRDVSASFESTAKAIDLTNVEVKKVGDNVTTLAGRTTTLETKQTDLTKGVEANTKSITTAQGKIETLEGQVQATNETTTELTSRVTSADIIARAMASNNQISEDPTFLKGTNGVKGYSVSANNLTRVGRQSDNPTTSQFQLEVRLPSAVTPAYGGFYKSVMSRASSETLIKYIMKIPAGVKCAPAANATGVNRFIQVIGNNEGTGAFESYYVYHKSGVTGAFSDFGYLYFDKTATNPAATPTPTAPWVIQLASIEIYDLSDYKDVSPVIADSMAAIKSTAQTAADTSKANTTEIGKHTSRLDVVEGQVANKLDASFQNTVYTKAQTDAKAKEVASGQITEYNAGLVLSSSNLLMRSNIQAKKVAGSNPYPFAMYKSGSGNFVTGKTYTLMFEAEFTKSGTDAGFYAYFGGHQAILIKDSSFTRQVFKTTIIKNGSIVNSIDFYIIPADNDSSRASTATVYWATLYEGDNPPYADWIPSKYDTIAYTVFSSSFGGDGQGLRDADNGYSSSWAWTTGARGIALHTFDANGVRLSSTVYDTYAGVAASTALTNALNALATGAQVALTSFDAINAVTPELQTALNSIGVSSLSMPTTAGRHVILYVGTKGNAIGSAVEMFSPAGTTTPPLSYLLTFNRGKAEGLSGTGGTANVIKQVEASVTEVDGKYIALNKDYTQYKTQVDQNFANIAVTYQTKAAAEQSAANLTTEITSAYRNEILESVTIKDTRNDNQTPQWYYNNYPRRIVTEFKLQSVLRLTGMGTYVTLITTCRWNDSSGGAAYQEARSSDSKLVKFRSASSNTVWGAWVDNLADIDAKINKKLDATVITDYSTTVKMNEAITAATTKVTAEYKADIDAIAVGGANLAPNSSFNENLTGWYSNGGSHSIVADATLKNGSTSCWKMVATNAGNGLYQGIGNIISDVGVDVTASIWARGEVGGEKLTLLSENHSASTSITLTTTWQRYTFTAKKTAAYLNLTIYSESAGTFYLSEYQYERGNKATDWKPYYGDTQKALEANATAVSSLGGRVTTAEGKLVTQADTITQLNTRVGNNETAVQIQGQSIDGINAKYTVKINNNGYMTGYGLISTQVNGVVVSAFKIDSDAFIVGKGNQSIAPMVVVTTPQTINGQYYPAGAWFNVAGIVEASIKTAHIQDAAINSAKIAKLAVETGHIKDLAVDTLKIKDRAITTPLSSIQALSVSKNWNGYNLISGLTYDTNITGLGLHNLTAGSYCTIFVRSDWLFAMDYTDSASNTLSRIRAQIILAGIVIATIKPSITIGDLMFADVGGGEGGYPPPTKVVTSIKKTLEVSADAMSMYGFNMPAGVTANTPLIIRLLIDSVSGYYTFSVKASTISVFTTEFKK